MNFNGKNVVFVGGLGGIGYETCKQLLKKPIASLFVLDVIKNASAVQTLQAINSKCKVRYIKFDITDKSLIKNTIKSIVGEVKYIDILVNGAGIISEENYERMLSINLIGLITTTYEALPYMDKQRYGRGGLIANIASVAGLEPVGATVAYTSTKFGVVGFTRALADPYYYKLTGVAVTAICPGKTETALKCDFFTNYTFEFSKPLLDQFHTAKCQTAAACGEHLLRMIEANKNGSFWLSDGDFREIEMKVYWTPAQE